jgi:sigma-B regulation protein RsbU (phosphoserine phosphatase)
MFVTLFCGVLDLRTGGFSYANAGHNPPVLLDADNGGRFLDVSKGIVAGIMDGARYPLGHIQLDPHKTILMYTDGVTEAMNDQGGFYTDERLLEAAERSASASARELVSQVHDSVIRFAGNAPQADDITLLALRWRPLQSQS